MFTCRQTALSARLSCQLYQPLQNNAMGLSRYDGPVQQAESGRGYFRGVGTQACRACMRPHLLSALHGRVRPVFLPAL